MVRLNAVSSVGANIATAVGDAGTILRTIDGGATWMAQRSLTTKKLYAVWFINSNLGLAVGENGIMLRTSNGGSTWIAQQSGTLNNLYAVCFTDVSRGIVVGNYGTILCTITSDVIAGVGPRDPLPLDFILEQNYPNPFNPSTNFEFRVSYFGFVTLKVFDILGREIATLVNEERSPGTYTVRWDASGFPSGVYFYRLYARPRSGGHADDFIQSKKMLLIK